MTTTAAQRAAPLVTPQSTHRADQPPKPVSADDDAMTPPARTAGMTMIEVLVVCAIIGILSAIGLLNVKGLHDEVGSATTVTLGALNSARTSALETMQAVQVRVSGTDLIIESAASCAGPFTTRRSEAVQEVTLTPAPWAACFNSRGQVRTLPGTLTVRSTVRPTRVRTLSVAITGAAYTN